MEQRASERATRTRFEVNAATGPDAHPSGITVQTKLDNPHPSDPFRTGQLVNGHIHISAPAATRISNLSLQVYYESRTLGWSLEPQVPEQRYSRFTSPPYDNIVRHEVHRGHVNVMRSWDPASVVLGPEVALPFSFVLPRRMGVSESSAARERWADQCPPPSLTNSRVCGVQWIVQVVVDLVPNPQEEYDATLLRLSTEDQVVSRLVFPVMPSFEDVDVLRDEPCFSKDLALDPFGSCMLSEEEMVSVRKSTLATVRMRGWGWEAYIRELALQNKCTVASELYTIGGSRITTDILELPLVLFLKRTATQPGRSRSLFRSAPKPKSVHLRRVLVRLLCVTLTRGGNDIRTHTSSRLIRQQDLRFDQHGSPNPALGLPIPVEGSASPLELDLTLDLQSQTEMRLMSGNRVSTPARDLVPSFRTPNIQYEYLLTVSMWFAEDRIERCAARFPVQVIPSDEAQLPLFEDAVAAQPPAFIDDSAPPQYGYF